MAKNYTIIPYTSNYKYMWDEFLNENISTGTFLQSRRFLEYHPSTRFKDNSLIILNGNSIVALIPGNVETGAEGKVFVSHRGSTFGGIVIGQENLKVGVLDTIFDLIDQYFVEHGFKKAVFKLSGSIYIPARTDLLEYFFFNRGYRESLEVGYYLAFSNYQEDIISNFSSSKRRDYKYSLKNKLRFIELTSDEEVMLFFDILNENYEKFGKKPVHSLNELIDFKNSRLRGIVRFFGVYQEKEMLAGGMVFSFDKRVFHTQYLAARQKETRLFLNEFLYKT